MKGSDKGWVTAEYGMLPRSTNERRVEKQQEENSQGELRKYKDLLEDPLDNL